MTVVDKEDLLDSKALFDVKMLERIFHNHGTIAKSILVNYMHTTQRMVSDHVASLNSNLKYLCQDENIGLTETRSTITLVMDPIYSLEELTNRIIRDSLPYQILAYVFWHNSFTMQKMQQDLMISESTLFRTMNKVNHLIAEFDISIRNNHINGREIDIRHFYYKFFVTLNNSDPKLTTLSQPQFKDFITDYEALIHEPLSEVARNSMRIYWNVVMQRLNLHDHNEHVDVISIADIEKYDYGQRLIEIFRKNFNIFLKNHLGFEVLSFIVYVSFEHVVPINSEFFQIIYNSDLPYVQKIRNTTNEVLALLDMKFDLELHRDFLRYAFFSELGNILFMPGVLGSRHQLLYTAMKGIFWSADSGQAKFRDFLIHRLQRHDAVFKKPTIVHFLVNYFTSILLLLLNHTKRQFKLAFYDNHEQSINYYLIYGLTVQTRANFNISLENFVPGQKYDAILTSTNYFDTKEITASISDTKNIIEVKDFGTPEDFNRIFLLLDRLVSEYLSSNLTALY
ncbi:helix-turn-helix domain-containing protein [Lactobacillus sp. CC-MHH1034]|uniref:helix-turn-helix domain-containing protein n=1 Tax=Agrilactobacillus fermenti TaxID=2586909 RepID=UPI001E4B57D4|nr:helix-turn-helix domain-containing protein [Agrilactobacillus fermenti]MCD2256512.1 helix-turn-helix domain-containing protein [Agrilactobacillus fermenti]